MSHGNGERRLKIKRISVKQWTMKYPLPYPLCSFTASQKETVKPLTDVIPFLNVIFSKAKIH
jgi:hypothetical protein